jgi:hypothetical protein
MIIECNDKLSVTLTESPDETYRKLLELVV